MRVMGDVPGAPTTMAGCLDLVTSRKPPTPERTASQKEHLAALHKWATGGGGSATTGIPRFVVAAFGCVWAGPCKYRCRALGCRVQWDGHIQNILDGPKIL